MPSAMRLKLMMVAKMHNPGNITSHQALNCSRLSANSRPQLTVSSGTPMFKKDNDDSVMMADAMPNAMVTNAGAMALGKA